MAEKRERMGSKECGSSSGRAVLGRSPYDRKSGRLHFRHEQATIVTAVPYDIPIIGYETGTVNTLRLWNAEPYAHYHGGNILSYKRETEAVSEFLYPDDTHDEGKILRLKQQYFLVCASLKSIVNNYRKTHKSLSGLHKK